MVGSLSQCPAAFQSAYHVQPGIVTAVQSRSIGAVENRKRAERQREIETRSDFGSGEFGRRHTDHFQRTILYEQTGADGRQTSAEFSLPEGITKDYARSRTAAEVI